MCVSGPWRLLCTIQLNIDLVHSKMRKSLWSPDEDEKLRQYVAKHGCGNWSDVAKHTGLHRCGKSCRLRWINYLRPDLKRGPFTAHEIRLVVHLHNNLGNSWSKIATHLPGRTDNDVKNFWHSYTRSRRLQQQQLGNLPLSDNAPPTDKDAENSTKEERCCYSDVNNVDAAVFDLETMSKEVFEQNGSCAGHLDDEFHLPAFSRGMCMREYDVVGSEHDYLPDNIPPFYFNGNVPENFGLPSSSSAPDIIMGNEHSSGLSLLYPSSTHTQSMQAANINSIASTLDTYKPPLITMNTHVIGDSDLLDAPSTCSPLFLHTASGHKVDLYTAAFDQCTPWHEASSTATHINNRTTKRTGQGWSLTLHPSSMQVYKLLNKAVVADDYTSTASFDQVSSDMGSIIKPPEGLQSVIWRFINQQEECMAASSSYLIDQERMHHSHLHSPLQKPSSSAISSLARRSEVEIQDYMLELLAVRQSLNAQNATSYSSNSIQHLSQDQLTNFLDEYNNPPGTALCSSG